MKFSDSIFSNSNARKKNTFCKICKWKQKVIALNIYERWNVILKHVVSYV